VGLRPHLSEDARGVRLPGLRQGRLLTHDRRLADRDSPQNRPRPGRAGDGVHLRRPGAGELVAHTDRGSQYTSFRYTQRLADLGIAASVGSIADAYDNAMAESFVGTLKTELVAGRVFATRFEAEIAVVEYLGWFNHTRLHETLGDLPPAEFENLYASPNETITDTIMSKETN
jgi:hypothetical protein